ncbi:hypothetical protein DMP23_00195 [Amycolatopsis sp. A1MSW2902]|uniref:hypothetical protein n=1 Tax=Amycolatopsis sp. A1MSW2902 TaxID=687413 RepID=UPI00307CFAF8
MNPDEISAIVRDPNDPRYPCRLGVFCDRCGTEWVGDFLVSDEVSSPERLKIVRDHVSGKLGWVCEQSGDFCPACNQRRRADAAEAKLADALRCISTREEQITTGTSRLGEIRRERDAVLSKLDAIADHAAGFHAAMLGPARCNPDSVRTRAVAALDGIRDVITDQSPAASERSDEPMTDREEPCDCQPFDFCPKCCTPESQEETRIRQLAYCEASVQASTDPEDGEQCRELREHGSIYCEQHGSRGDLDARILRGEEDDRA